MTADNAMQSFRDELRAKAAQKRKLAFEVFKRKKELARVSRKQMTRASNDVLTAIGEKIDRLTDLIMEQRAGKVKNVEFIIIGRDNDGHVKSFKAIA